jgi:hypothetical protein
MAHMSANPEGQSVQAWGMGLRLTDTLLLHHVPHMHVLVCAYAVVVGTLVPAFYMSGPREVFFDNEKNFGR